MMNPQPSKVIPIAGINEQEFTAARATTEKLPLASIGLRCAAFLLDYILMWLVPAITLSIALLFKRAMPGLAWTILYVGYAAAFGLVLVNWIYLVRTDGQTLGKRILGIRVVRRDGGPLGYREVIVRLLVGYPLALLSFGLGFLWALWDQKQQGWHDKLAGTVVVRVQ
ncbi:MAG TPA: RDD family protein [Blastocatellia bacterium]|nr:RDD family protein [Blastocatellia bacterium]